MKASTRGLAADGGDAMSKSGGASTVSARSVQRLDRHSDEAGGRRDDRRFEQHLPDSAAARRAERRADGEFVLAADRRREEQVADVRAGDEQHERDGSLEQEQQPARARDEQAVPLGQRGAGVRRVGRRILHAQPRHDRVEIGAGLLERHSRTQTADDAEKARVAPRAPRIGVDGKRRDQIRVAHGRDEGRRQDPTIA